MGCRYWDRRSCSASAHGRSITTADCCFCARSSRLDRDLLDAAARLAGLDAAPQDLVALRQRPVVGHGEPQPQQQAVVAARGLVLERRATVIGDMAVDELQVA